MQPDTPRANRQRRGDSTSVARRAALLALCACLVVAPVLPAAGWTADDPVTEEQESAALAAGNDTAPGADLGRTLAVHEARVGASLEASVLETELAAAQDDRARARRLAAFRDRLSTFVDALRSSSNGSATADRPIREARTRARAEGVRDLAERADATVDSLPEDATNDTGVDEATFEAIADDSSSIPTDDARGTDESSVETDDDRSRPQFVFDDDRFDDWQTDDVRSDHRADGWNWSSPWRRPGGNWYDDWSDDREHSDRTWSDEDHGWTDGGANRTDRNATDHADDWPDDGHGQWGDDADHDQWSDEERDQWSDDERHEWQANESDDAWNEDDPDREWDSGDERDDWSSDGDSVGEEWGGDAPDGDWSDAPEDDQALEDDDAPEEDHAPEHDWSGDPANDGWGGDSTNDGWDSHSTNDDWSDDGGDDARSETGSANASSGDDAADDWDASDDDWDEGATNETEAWSDADRRDEDADWGFEQDDDREFEP